MFFNFLNGKKIVSVFLLSVFINTSAKTMEQQSDDILHTIFLNLDPKEVHKTASVCKKWLTIVYGQELWHGYCKRHFGQHIDKVKFSSLDKQYYQRLKNFVLMFDISLRSQENLILALDAKELEKDLIDYLECRLILLLEGKITDVKALASFVIAHHVVNISLAENTVQKLLFKIWWSRKTILVDDSEFEKEDSKLNDLPILMAHKACATVCNDPALFTAYEAAHKLFGMASTKKTWNLAKIIYDLNIHSQNRIDKYNASTKLALLTSLSESSQEDFFKDQFFLNVYEAAYQSLAESNFSLNLDEIMAIIAGNTWEKEELASNPFIASLKRMFDDLARRSFSNK